MEETTVLLERAKKEQTTVHAALVAALTLAGKRYSDAWRVGPVRCMSPIDMRKTLGLPDAAGLLLSLHQGPVPTTDGASFWDIARAVREDMLPAQTADGARDLLSVMSSSVAEEHNARDLYWSVLNGPMLHELMVTNYAGYRARSEYGDLKLETLYGQFFCYASPAKSLGPHSERKAWNDSRRPRCVSNLAGGCTRHSKLEDVHDILTRV
jgi:hypothetical protein